MPVEGLVSVIIPAFNAELFIAAAIRSVLQQGHVAKAIIVVDDGSTDGTADAVQAFGSAVTLIRQANGGPPSARNRGLGVAQGEFIGFLDADDVYEPGSLALQVTKLQGDPAAAIAIGRLQREEVASAPGEPLAFRPIETEEKISTQLGVCLFRRSVFDQVGLLDESLRHCDDWDWFMRARECQVRMLLHDGLLLRQRLHWSNITRDQEANRTYLALMLRKSLQRRRSGHGEAKSLAPLAAQREAGPQGED
jgi:glycosyltransferase involved in cell wall biosynthesis